MACRGSSTMAGNHGVGSLGMKQLDGAKLDGDAARGCRAVVTAMKTAHRATEYAAAAIARNRRSHTKPMSSPAGVTRW
uniref:Uncharacterized protein n=1 Tax=Oryza sativa subsp. japonica TaxID=39947 RepID=Q8S6L0_ORYSJ|nr:Hypothetical protein [Oryza sativa Japonica Group]